MAVQVGKSKQKKTTKPIPAELPTLLTLRKSPSFLSFSVPKLEFRLIFPSTSAPACCSVIVSA